VAAGHGITLAHSLNILTNPDQVIAVPPARASYDARAR
jgi:hypothetical protein